MESENYVYKKEIDWSTLMEGFTLPLDNQVIFLRNMENFLQRGQSKIIHFFMNGKTYDAKIVNMNNSVEKRKKDAYQIRYPRNGELSQALQQYFFKSMSYIKMIRENRDPKDRSYIKMPDTLEVDFVSEESNKDFVCSVIRNTYKDATVIERHVSTIKSGTEAERYDSVMTVANNIKKGWYATLLAETIDARAVIPMYILDAIVFAAKDILSEKLLWKMVQYSFEQYLPDSDFDDLKAAFKEAKSSKEIQTTIKEFCAEFPEDMVSLFIAKAGGLNV